MKKNMGAADRIIRVIIAAIILILYFSDVIGGTLFVVLLVIAAIFTLTSIVGICPLYIPFKISTCPKKK